MEDYYSILQISSDADEKEIKRAYSKMLRKYPPEKEPEKFNKINEAYETLSNSKLRKNYDAHLQYGGVIEENDEIGQKALDDEDYETAISAYKKILVFSPDLDFAKTKLILAFVGNEQYAEAEKQCRELIRKYPDEPLYYKNLAFVYKSQEKYTEAEKQYLKAYKLDEYNESTIIQLSDLYFDMEQYQKAVTFLRNAMEDFSDAETQRLIYNFRIVSIYIVADKAESAKKELEYIFKNLSKDEEIHNFAVNQLTTLLFQLDDVNKYSLMKELLDIALKYVADDNLKELHEYTEKQIIVFNQYEKLQASDEILPCFKLLTALWMSKTISDELREEYYNKYSDMLNDESVFDICDNIKIIKSEYPKVYELNAKYLDELYEAADNDSTSLAFAGSGGTPYVANRNDNSGCAPILCGIIGAAIGSAIIPVIGTWVGYLIGRWIGKNL